MAARDGADGGTGSARRRRERRLRSWLRHEQQSIAAVLASVTHHSFRKVGTASGVLRNQKTATRTDPENGPEEFETHFTAEDPEDSSSISLAEQVVEVPKISLSPRPSRSCIPEPQVAEQLVEVPTVLSLLRIAEQIVGTPVPLGRGQRRVQGVFPQDRVQQSCTLARNAFLSGFWSRPFSLFVRNAFLSGSWSRSLISLFLVETFLLVEVLTVFSPARVLQRLPLRMLTFWLVEVLTVHAQDRVPRRVPEHGRDAARRSRRGGGSVAGPQGSVPGQSSSARGRARHRRFVGRLFILPGSRGCSFIESSAEAEFGDAAFGGFRVPVSWQGHFAEDASVTFSVRTGPDGFMEPCDIEAAGWG